MFHSLAHKHAWFSHDFLILVVFIFKYNVSRLIILISNQVNSFYHCDKLHAINKLHFISILVVTSSVRYREPIYLRNSLHRPFSTYKMETKEELRKRLTPMQYQVTQESGTERPFTGKYNKCYDKGVYKCIVCHDDLFSSDTKYDSGCGWPAFNDVVDQGKVTLHKDTSYAGTATKKTCFNVTQLCQIYSHLSSIQCKY